MDVTRYPFPGIVSAVSRDSLSRPGQLIKVTCPRTYLESSRMDAIAEPIGRYRNGI